MTAALPNNVTDNITDQEVVELDPRWVQLHAQVLEFNRKNGIRDGNGHLIVPPEDPCKGIGIRPAGHRLLVKPREVEAVTPGGIVLAKHTIDNEQMAQIDGVVVAIGDGCYDDVDTPWCAVGDHVMFGKYKGLTREGKDGVKYRVINDKDVVCVIDPDLPQQA